MSEIYNSGLVAPTTNADAFLQSDLYVSGNIYWVDSVNGDSGGPGTFDEPYDTLANALGAATTANGDLIVIKADHSEVLSSSLQISKSIKIFGLGTGSSKPSFTCDGNIDMFDIIVARVEVNNLRFPVGTTAANTARINVAGSTAIIRNCDFACGQYDLNTITISSSGPDLELDSCTFSVSADGPDSAVTTESGSAHGLMIKNCSFNGNNINWDNAAIFNDSAINSFRFENINLINSAIIYNNASAKGYISKLIMGDDCRLEW